MLIFRQIAKVSIYMPCDGLMKISDYLCTIFGLHGVFSVQRHTLAQKIRYSASRTLPRCFYVWGYAPYNPSTANQLKCSLLRLSISFDSWFRLLIPYSQLTLALWNNNPDNKFLIPYSLICAKQICFHRDAQFLPFYTLFA